jgi:hypothetical protein
MRDNAIFGGGFRRHEGFQKWLSRFLKTPKTSDVAAECGGRLRAEGVSGRQRRTWRGGARRRE